MSHSQNTWRRDSFTELSLAELLPKSHTENIDVTQSESGDPNVGLSANSGVSASVGELIGRFRVTGVLGEGGYGRVFKAYDDQLQRHVAIKVPHIYRISSPAAVEKYLDEARTLAKLNHPGIVAVYDVGVTVAGVPYIVSALVEGTSLALRMHTSPLTLGDALKLLVDVANALDDWVVVFAHDGFHFWSVWIDHFSQILPCTKRSSFACEHNCTHFIVGCTVVERAL